MANQPKVILGKKELINKANKNMVIAVAAAAFMVVFVVISSQALWSARNFQSRVIAKKKTAVKTLEENKETVKKLAESYKVFVETPDNVIGGNPSGNGDKDGNNAKIVLDALPSKYDFPAFLTSVDKLLKIKGFSLDSIGGEDDEVAQSAANNTKPVDIPFKFSSSVNSYAKLKELLQTTELSIRPISISQMDITGGDASEIKVNVEAKSSYQGSKGVTITKEVVK